MSRTAIYVHVYIKLDFLITYRNDSVLYQSECACLHKTVNMVSLLTVMKIPTQKRALMYIYRVVPITK